MTWLALFGVAGVLLYLLAPILTPFVASALLAYVGDPLVDRLERIRLSRTIAVVVVLLLTLALLALLILLVLPLFRAQIEALMGRLPEYVAWVETQVLPRLYDLAGAPGSEDVGLSAFVAEYAGVAGSWGSKVIGSLSRSGSSVLTGIVTVCLVPVLTFYLLRDWDRMLAKLGLLVPRGRRPTVFQLARDVDLVLGGFLRGQVLVMLGLATLYAVGLAILGLDFAIAIGIVSGLVSFVPYLGFIVGITLAGMAALAEGGGLLLLAGVVAVFTFAQAIEGTLLTPRLVGSRIGLHPVLVIFAVLAGGQLFGFFGILLALPAAAVLSVMVRFAFSHYFPAEHQDLSTEE